MTTSLRLYATIALVSAFNLLIVKVIRYGNNSIVVGNCSEGICTMIVFDCLLSPWHYDQIRA